MSGRSPLPSVPRGPEHDYPAWGRGGGREVRGWRVDEGEREKHWDKEREEDGSDSEEERV